MGEHDCVNDNGNGRPGNGFERLGWMWKDVGGSERQWEIVGGCER